MQSGRLFFVVGIIRQYPSTDIVIDNQRQYLSKDFFQILSEHDFPPPASLAMVELAGGGKSCSERIQTISFDRYCLRPLTILSVEGYFPNPFGTQLSTTGEFRHGETCRWWKKEFRNDSDNILRQILSSVSKDDICRRIFSGSFYNFFNTTGKIGHGPNLPVVLKKIAK